MKRLFTIIAICLCLPTFSWGQSLLGRWDGPRRNDHGTECSWQMEFFTGGKFSIYITFEIHEKRLQAFDTSFVVPAMINGEYEHFGKALSQTFTGDIVFSPAAYFKYGDNCPFDKEQKKILEKEIPNIVKDVYPEMKRFARVLMTAGVYKQIIMLNDTDLWIGGEKTIERYQRVIE